MPCDGEASGDGRALESVRAAIAVLEIDQHVLWAEYLGLLGEYSYRRFADALQGRGRFSVSEYNKLAAALNERFTDRGLDHPVPYRDGAPEQGDPGPD